MKKINWKKESLSTIGVFLFLIAIEQVLLIRKVPFSMHAMLYFALSTFWKLGIIFILRIGYLKYFATTTKSTV